MLRVVCRQLVTTALQADDQRSAELEEQCISVVPIQKKSGMVDKEYDRTRKDICA